MHIVNLISIIKNGLMRRKAYVESLNNKKIRSFLRLLVQEGYIQGFKSIKKNRHLIIYLKYFKNEHTIKILKIISKPSIRRYITVKELTKLNRTVIVSTSLGLMMGAEAIRLNKGGELLAHIN